MTRKKTSGGMPPVKISYSFLKILTGSDLSRRRLPLMAASSARPGPSVWLTACVHGDEICGMVIIQELFRKIRKSLLRGTIRAFPLMNPIGFETASRNITMSGEDLNRSFPGKATGSLGKIIADRIFGAITETAPDLVIDLHNDWKKSIPYVLLDRESGKLKKAAYEKTKTFARQTGFAIITDPEEMTGSLSYNLLRVGIPAMTFELGEPYVINERNVAFGLGAIRNVLANLRMIARPDEPFAYPLPPAFATGRLFRYSDKPYSSKSGIIRFIAKPGDEIRKGKPFAKIVNAFGKHQETVRAESDAIVLGHADTSAVFPGMPIMAFGVN